MKIKKIIKYFLLVISLLLLFLSIYIKITFNDISIEQLIFSLFTSEGTNYDAIVRGSIFVVICIVVSITLLKLLKIIIKKLMLKIKTHILVQFKYKNKILNIDLLKPSKRKENLIFSIGLIILIIASVKLIKLDEYISYQLSASNIFEEYYVDPMDAKIKFPKEKNNLIYIYVESLEMTNASMANGGGVNTSYIPNLEKIALDENNINFSNTSKLGGALTLSGTDWTAAALISQTAGIPLKLSIDPNSYSNYGNSLPGAHSLGDILKENGYNNYLFIGSDAEFGGRKDYFTYHGDYIIYDYNYAKENNWIDHDYYVWWGYEDKKLFEFAKKTLLEISKSDEPFNFTMLTADTHFFDGYFDDSCKETFDKRYASVFNCSDGMLNKFISWIQKQKFYENTTIIITGDHLTMQEGFYENLPDNYDRNIYNVFINSKTEPQKIKNRLFSSLDMFPTTLSSLGVEIKGDRLGLGTNLFSKEDTYIEKFGYDYFNNELQKKSFFYDNYLLGDTYYKMQQE